jgi:hypothetical protein
MKKLIFISFIICKAITCFGQGFNHTWLIGYGNFPNKARFNFSINSYQYIIEQREMGFEGTQGNISDINGNFLMSSNGVYIANANNDTMMNGSGLNPGPFVDAWDKGLPVPYGNFFLPWPDSSHKYILIHQLGSTEIYYSIIDISLNNGLGEVVEKNNLFYQGSITWGMNACRHANGRDWWIVALSDSANKIFTFLLTPTGLQYNNTQIFSVPGFPGTSTQPTFSPDGNKFAYASGYSFGGNWAKRVYLYNFDRCNGSFSLLSVIDNSDGLPGAGIAFAPNSKYLYSCSYHKIFQINTDTVDIIGSLKIVAINDTFYSPSPPFLTDFRFMYLAANGKIYITSGNSVSHHHYINYPNLGDTLCDVVQHGLDLNGIRSFRAIPNHPNYYLGCDTTLGCPCLVFTDINEVSHDFRFNVYPNPSSGNFNIIYLLPQNKEGKLEIFDITGKIIYEMRLPQWSTLQQITLPNYIANGLYNVIITSDNQRVNKKIAVIKN